MARALDANQILKINRPYVQPIYFAHLLLSGLTLYFSDRNFSYNGHNYEDYFCDLSDIGNEIKNLGGGENAKVTIRFKNDKILAKNTLIELFDDYPPEKKYIEIYKLYIDTGEVFVSDVSTKIFKGEMGQPYEIYDPATDFKIDCSLMLFGKNASLPLDVIDLVDFPSADPDDVGKYRNILYGSLKKVVCPWTVAGWLSTLTADIAYNATSIVVSDSNRCPVTPFTSFIDNEEVRITGNTKATGTLTITRGYNSTTAVTHNKAATIYEKRTDFEVEVAQHPVKAINDIYVQKDDKEWLRVISGATKNINIAGRATIVLSDQVKYEEKTNLITATVTGTHPHVASSSLTGNNIKKCIPTGGPSAMIDGNEDSYASGGGTISFSEANLGTIVKQYVWIKLAVASSSIQVYCGGTGLGLTAAVTGWQRKTKTGGAWGDNIVLDSGAIAEVYKEVEYTPSITTTVDTHAADGVSTTMSGNSVANMKIGNLVACDVDGYADLDGNYGGIGTLIERPDWIRKHILIILLGFVAGDIGASFGTVGTTYGSQISGGYKFAFNLPEVAKETMDLFEKMDLQTRSNMFESGGKFNLAFGSTTDPTSQITFDKNNIKGSFTFSKSEVVDIRNKLRGYYFRDYSKSGGLGDQYQKNNEKSNVVSIIKYGLMQEDIEFSCIGDLSAMVDDVLTWILIEKEELKKIVEFDAYWDAMILEHCDHFIVTSNFWSGKKFKTIRLEENQLNQTIAIKGTEFSAPFVKYGTGIKYGDDYKYDQLI